MTDFSFEHFSALVRQEQAARDDSCLNSPFYYAMTGRKGLWLHEGYGSVMAVCRHPNKSDSVLAFPELRIDPDGGRGRLAASVLSNLDAPPGGVQLARYSSEDIIKLRDVFAQNNVSSIVGFDAVSEDIMDWKYPVHIIDTARVSAMAGTPFVKIRNKCRKVEDTVEIMPWTDPVALRAMRAVVKYWEGSMVMREKDNEDMADFYDVLFQMIQNNPDEFGGLVFMQGRRPVGFCVYDASHTKTVNLLANLSDATIAGLADYQIVETCRVLHQRGVVHMNFGGSENKTLDDFKRKFMPCKSLHVLSAKVQYMDRYDVNVRSAQWTPRWNC